MQRKAVVLLITLGFIAIITMLVLHTVSLTKQSFDELLDIKAENQMMLLITNFEDILKKQNAKDFRDNFMDQDIPIIDSKSGLNVTVHCKDLTTRFNLNKLLSCIIKTNNTQCAKPIVNYLDKKELSDYYLFLEMLKDTYDIDHKEGLGGSELAIEDMDFQEGNITSFKTISKIKDEYFKLLKDPKVLDITKEDFEKVFYFYEEIYKDNNLTTPPNQEVCLSLGYEESNQECQDSFNTVVNSSNSKPYDTNKTKSLIQCSIKLYNGDNINQTTFKYNLSDKNKEKKLESIDEFF